MDAFPPPRCRSAAPPRNSKYATPTSVCCPAELPMTFKATAICNNSAIGLLRGSAQGGSLRLTWWGRLEPAAPDQARARNRPEVSGPAALAEAPGAGFVPRVRGSAGGAGAREVGDDVRATKRRMARLGQRAPFADHVRTRRKATYERGRGGRVMTQTGP